MFKKKVLETRGVKVNLKKGTVQLPEQALAKIKKYIKKNAKGHSNGTYILEDGVTYTKYGKKESCHRKAYLVKDYLVLPLTADNIKKPQILSEDKYEVVEEVEVETVTEDNELESLDKTFDEVIVDDFKIPVVDRKDKPEFTFTFRRGEEVLLDEILSNSYFIYNNELYVKQAAPKGFSPKRIPDMLPISYIIDTKSTNIYGLKVHKAILGVK